MDNEPRQPLKPGKRALSNGPSLASNLRMPIGHGGEWLVWRDFCLRSAGFPFSQLAITADRECAVLADQYAENSHTESEFRDHWDATLERILEAMFDIVDTGGVRQALIWQNPGFLARAVDWLRRDTGEGIPLPPRNRHRKRRELTLIKYLQRYHTKNETIGFFGPSTWGRFSETIESFQLRPGRELIRDRSIVFEDWAMESLARVFAEDFGLRLYLPPTLSMDVRLHGRAVLRSDAPTVVLDPDLAIVASCCDGIRTPRSIAAELSWRGGTKRRTIESINKDLEELAHQGIISWGFDIPPSPLAAESLRTQLTKIPATPARDQAITVLGDLEQLRCAIPQATEGAEDLRKALNDLDEKFREVTKTSAYRESNSAAKGRRVVVEDCQRDIDVTLGTDFLRDIGHTMGVVLTSARWLLSQLGIVYTEVLESIVAELGGQSGRDIPLIDVISNILPALEKQNVEERVISDFQERWRRILGYDHAQARQSYTIEQIQDSASQLFDAPSPPPWHSAGYHSPDVMLAEDTDTNGLFAVMGEMHVSQASFNSLSFTQFHPNCKDLVAAADEYVHPYPCFVPLYPRSLPDISARFYPTPELQSERYSYLSFGPRCGARSAPQDRIEQIEELVVRSSATGLRVVHRADDQPGTPLLEVLGEFLVLRATDSFRLMPALPHTPRVTINRLVVSRETWRPCLADVPVGKGKDEAAAFAGIRQWARRLGIPRHVFWRVPWEPKPIYLDFESPLLVGLFAMTLRSAPRKPEQHVTISEMLPAPDQLWLRDADDRRYTSELRMVFVDSLRELTVDE